MVGFGKDAVDAACESVVGRRREIEMVVAALAADRHILLEGPPGTGKSTLLRTVAREAGVPFVFVEGNAELTPARLAGQFDPARVLTDGYTPEVFIDGPLTEAVREGALLYLEELNRVPEETLNLLITAMSEREVHVPRLGHIPAAPGFRLVAAMNPFDAVGTARISAAVYDRMCRVAMGYQSAADEVAITAHEAGVPAGDLTVRFVEVCRATREHPEIRIGSSVRGAIDGLLLAQQLSAIRGDGSAATLLDAALAALSGRIRLHEGSARSAEEIVTELFLGVFGEDAEEGGEPSGKGGTPAGVTAG
ncbi:MAG: MoxR family ATPase [Actinomycetota bacterium]